MTISIAGGIAACGHKGNRTEKANQPPAKAGVNDIAAVARDQVKDGGQLVWPISAIPPNFNVGQVDGTIRYNNEIVGALLPRLFLIDAAGNPIWNRNYLAAEPTVQRTPKQKVTYRLNPRARWNDGTPITWADFEAQWKARNGRNKAYKISGSSGYADVESVTRGADDLEVIVTYGKNYADWQTVFDRLYPKSTTSDPAVFNEGWIGKMPGPTAGPFTFSTVDQTAKTVTIVRDDAWWGNRPKLDRIIFQSVEDDASADALANGEVDFVEIGANVNLYKRANDLGTKVAIRRAGGPVWRHITINGAKPHLADPLIRQALSMGINREVIAKSLLAPLKVAPQVLNNRIFMTNHAEYQDNAGEVGKYHPEKAKSILDGVGWKLNGGVRKKDGREFVVDLVIPANVAAGKSEAELIKTMLKDIGVTVTIRSVPAGDLFDKYIFPGAFDMTVFSWTGTAFPISSSESIYKAPVKGDRGDLVVEQNYARVGNAEIDGMFKQATAELDRKKSVDLAQKIDSALWHLVPNIPLYQRPDLWAVKPDLVNFGAFAYASRVYEDIGFTRD